MSNSNSQSAHPQSVNHRDIHSRCASPSLAKMDVAAVAGIDWADQKHDLCLLDLEASGGPRYQEQIISHTPEALTALVNSWRERFPGRKVAVVLEQSRGALIHHLMGYDFLLLYPINPSALDSYRKTFKSSGAKNDTTDAFLLCDLLYKHSDQYRPWHPQSEQTRMLERLTRDRRQAVNHQTRLTQQLQSTLKEYYPQALQWAGDSLNSPMALDFLERYPTLEAVKRPRTETLRRFYGQHHSRSQAKIEQRLEEIKNAQPLHRDSAIIASCRMKVAMLVAQLRALHDSIKAYDKAIAEIVKSHPDGDLFASFPGAGAQLAPRLIAAFGDDRERFANPGDMQQFSGIAPVIKKSGKSEHIHKRYACPGFIRQTFHEFAGHSISWSRWAKAYYNQQKAKGVATHVILRALAFKWQRIMWRCWKDGVTYEEELYIEALRRRNSPLADVLTAPPA